jgi:DNA-binding IclR family transcriptional regulator
MSPDIPEDVRRFVLTSVPSVPHLEAMLLFHRAPQEERTPAEIGSLLYLPEARAAELLQELCAAGFIAAAVESGRYRFSPHDAGLTAAVDRLARAYSTNLIGITHLIHNATGKSAMRFASAFQIRKDR